MGLKSLLNVEDLTRNFIRKSCKIMQKISNTASKILAKIFTKIHNKILTKIHHKIVTKVHDKIVFKTLAKILT